jgi:hypothetical protein
LPLLFNKFDSSIEAAKDKLEKRTKMSLEELLKDLGYY